MKITSVVAAFAAALLTIFGGHEAKAEPSAPLWTCHLSAKLQDKSFSVILGVINIVGKAEVKCVTALGQKMRSKRVNLKINGLSFGPDISFPTNENGGMRVRSVDFGLSSLASIYGEYSIQAGASARLGHSKVTASGKLVTFTPNFTKPGISSGISLALEHSGQFGLGVSMSLSGMTITPMP